MNSRLHQLSEHGQSVWLDFLERGFLLDGRLAKLIAEDGLKGVTSNPSIFEKAIGGGGIYQTAIEEFQARRPTTAMEVYEHLAIADIRLAADLLMPVYCESRGLDGYVSLEVSPYLARSIEGTIEEGQRLWQEVDRRNLMIKVPATPEGIIAVRSLIADGINVNVTLIFSLEVYESVLEAYLSGLEQRADKGFDISHVASVASFFISRVDAAIANLVDQRMRTEDPNSRALLNLKGKVAIAGAKIAYEHFQRHKERGRWKALEANGALPQRLLWASTGTKDPSYSDVLYVEELIGPETVNTMPIGTMDAFRDHGKARFSLASDLSEASVILAEATRLELDAENIGLVLLELGLAQFSGAMDLLLAAIEECCRRVS